MKLLGLISVGLSERDQLLIHFLHLSGPGEKWACSKTVHKLFIDFKKIEFDILMELG
jgi:hypothetical protein